MVRKYNLPAIFFLTILLAACAPQASPPLPPETVSTEPPAPVSAPPTEIVPPPAGNNEWVSYRDPREEAPAPILRSDVLKMEDLITGMSLKGTVRNVVDFGAFIDIGVKQDGLLHKSQIPRGTVLKVGDILDVEILKIEPERGRIGLGWIKA